MEQHREKIEEHGSMMEKMGLPPVAARIFIYLLLSPDHGATFEDIVSYFKVSKSAVSNALKMLTTTKMAEYKTIGGKRKRYFYINFASMFNEEYMTSRFAIFSNMLDDIQKVRGVEDEFSVELNNVSKLYKMLLIEFPIIIERWKKIIEMDKKR